MVDESTWRVGAWASIPRYGCRPSGKTPTLLTPIYMTQASPRLPTWGSRQTWVTWAVGTSWMLSPHTPNMVSTPILNHTRKISHPHSLLFLQHRHCVTLPAAHRLPSTFLSAPFASTRVISNTSSLSVDTSASFTILSLSKPNKIFLYTYPLFSLPFHSLHLNTKLSFIL